MPVMRANVSTWVSALSVMTPSNVTVPTHRSGVNFASRVGRYVTETEVNNSICLVIKYAKL